MIFFEEEFDLLDAFIGEGRDPVVIVGAVDPDDAVLGLDDALQDLAALLHHHLAQIVAVKVQQIEGDEIEIVLASRNRFSQLGSG